MVFPWNEEAADGEPFSVRSVLPRRRSLRRARWRASPTGPGCSTTHLDTLARVGEAWLDSDGRYHRVDSRA